MPAQQLTILAPGLLGGSVARAARARGAASRIVIWARSRKVAEAIEGQPWCDRVAGSPAEAARGADLLVIASPPDTVIELAAAAAAGLGAGAVVTDVASVKGAIARGAPAALAGRGLFVGSHPMAGSQRTGWEHGSAELFQGRPCFVTPLPDTPAAAVEKAAAFWSSLGATVVRTDPDSHDRIVAHISHLPQVVASCLCAFLASRGPEWRSFAGGGLRDTTRIAASDPKLWSVILEQNREEVLSALRGLQLEMAEFERALAAGDWPAVTAALERGKGYRDGLT